MVRDEIISLAKKHAMYFVIWYGHFATYFVALNNTSGKKPDIYGTMYEAFYDLVGNDSEAFRFTLHEPNMKWNIILEMLKAYFPTTRKLSYDKRQSTIAYIESA